MSQLLPQLRVDVSNAQSPRALFDAENSSHFPAEIWLEIGFGGGEHLLWQAKQNPDVGIIGCEPFEDGIAKVLEGVDRGKLSNIRIYDDDARDVLRWLPDGSVDRVFILFPDPWPKARHRKRRLVNSSLVTELSRIISPGGELRLGTDIADYARAMLIALHKVPKFSWAAATPADWRERPADWPQTRYEKKACQDGRRCYFFSLRRKCLAKKRILHLQHPAS